MTRILVAIVLAAAAATAASQTIYRWTDASGRVYYSNEPPPNAKVQPVADRINSYSGPVMVRAASGAKKASAREPGPVVMYATEWCGYCKKARAYFAANRISYQEYDIEKDPAAHAEFKRLGGRGVPLIVHGGATMSGFSEKGFQSLVARSQ